MIKIYRKIGGNNGSSLLSIGAGVSQGGTDGIEIKKVKLTGAYMEQYGIIQKRLIIPVIKKLVEQ